MSLTKNEIRDRVATDYLGILQLGQSLQSQDDVRILQGYDEVYEYLKKKGLASWASTASVPDDIVPYMVALVAKNCSTTYRLSTERSALLLNDASTAEAKIRELITTDEILADPPRNY